MTSVLFEVNHSRDFETFCDYRWTQQRNRQQQQVHHSRWQSFQFRFNSSSAEIVCNQLNFNRKIFVLSRILAEFFNLPDKLDNPNISRIISPAIHVFFRLQIGVYSLERIPPPTPRASDPLNCDCLNQKWFRFESGSPNWSRSCCPMDCSQNVVDSFPSLRHSLRRVSWKVACDWWLTV